MIMYGWLEFAKGPLFRFTFAIMILGLARLLILSIINGLEAKGKGRDKKLPMNFVWKLTLGFVLPIRAFRVKPLYIVVSIIFHIGLLLTPLFLFDHALLIDNAISFSWIGLTLSKTAADYLTIITIITGVAIFFLRWSNKASRAISRKQDFVWPLLLLVPFITGYVCGNSAMNPDSYKAFLLVHILSGELIFLLLPFTKISHCILMPISQWVTARSWKFSAQGPEDVRIALGKEGEPI
jgi:nitrate reductase gamma subunit